MREVAGQLLWLALFTIIYAPYFIWRYDTYGWFFPNTFYAKVGASSEQWDRGVRYITTFVEESGGWLLLVVPVAVAFTAIRRSAAIYVFALLAVWTGYVIYVGGDSLLRYRFFAPLMPLFYPLVVASIAALVRAADVPGAAKSWPRHTAIALAAAAAIALTLFPSAADSNRIFGERRAVDDRAETGRWMRDNLPGTTSVAAVPVGALAYESHLTVIDMLGINDEHIAHRGVDLGEFPAGHEKYDSQYVLDQQPDIIILSDGLSAEPLTAARYANLNGAFIPAVIDMLNTPRLAWAYERRAVKLQEGKWLNLYVLRSAKAVLAKTEPAPP